MSTRDIKKEVNEVIENLYDSCNGYKECAKEVDNPAMRQLFQRLATQRERMIQELKGRVELAGVEPAKSGSLTGAVHRTYIDIKSMVTGGDTQSMIKSVKFGEDNTLKHYKKALDEDIPPDLKQLLTRQMHTIENNLAEIDSQAKAS